MANAWTKPEYKLKKMKNYYEKQVKQIEKARKFIIDGIKAELFALSSNVDTDIKQEDLEFYAEIM